MLSRSKVKYIQSLAHKKLRDAAGEYVVEGPKMVEELLGWNPEALRALYATDAWVGSTGHLLPPHARALLTEVSPAELSDLSFQQHPNQVLALVSKPAPLGTPVLQGRITLLLDTLQDPGNLGTILRTADWFGIGQVVCSEDSADVFNPKVVQATMGAIFRLPVYYLDPLAVADSLGDVPLICAALEGDDLFDCPPLREAVIVIGNESRGASPALMARATHQVTIPRYGHAESLNAAVAAGIILSRLVRHGD